MGDIPFTFIANANPHLNDEKNHTRSGNATPGLCVMADNLIDNKRQGITVQNKWYVRSRGMTHGRGNLVSEVTALYAMWMDIEDMCNIQLVNIARKNLTVAAKAEGVVPLPGGRLGGVVVAATFPKTAVLFSNAGKTASLPALVHRLSDPADPWVAANLFARDP